MIGETIKSIEEASYCDQEIWILVMESGRRYKLLSHGYYGGESSLELKDVTEEDAQGKCAPRLTLAEFLMKRNDDEVATD